MTPTELTLSLMLWLCVGFLIGYRYHVLKVRDAVARRTKRLAELRRERALDRVLANVGVACIEQPTDARVN